MLCGARLWMGIVVAFGFFAPGAGAGTIQDSASDASHQALAQLFPSVGYLQFTSGGTSLVASGTLIGDEWVLTAAHTASGASNMTFLVGGNQYDIAETVIHPEWTGDATSGNDIALLRTDQPVTGVSPAPLFRETLGPSTGPEPPTCPEPPDTCPEPPPLDGVFIEVTATYVGYGRGGTGTTGATSAVGTFRAGQNVINSLGLSIFSTVFSGHIFFADFDDGSESDNFSVSLGSATPLPYEYMNASGDDGGGVFIEVEGQQRLAGVISFVGATDGNTDSDYGDFSGSTRVSSHLAWIDAFVAPAQPPAVPALGPWGIGALLTALVLAPRTRRPERGEYA